MKNKNMRRVSVLVTAQTLWHLQQAAVKSGVSIGRIIDEMVRQHQRGLQ